MTSSPQHEPTMEEILASIRKIISEDQPEGSAPQAEPAPAAAPAPAPEPEILELTDEVHDDGPVAPAPAAAPAPEPIDETDVAFEAIDDLPESTPEPAESDNDLISEGTRRKVAAVFESLEPAEPAPRPAAAPGGSVEAVFVQAVQDAFQPTLAGWVGGHTAEIMDHLKPLIRQWMDDNLPALIQAAVQTEVARAVKARRR